MSFGFSVGDFVSIGLLIKEIASALNGSSSAEYRELTNELQLLQQTLHEIEHLEGLPGQEDVINAVKFAALMCHTPLDEFASKLQKYDILAESDLKQNSRVAKSWGRKVQWNVSMKDEVHKLRAYLGVHLGSLNLRLTTLGLKAISLAAERSDQDRLTLDQRATQSHAALIDLQTEMRACGESSKLNLTGFNILRSIMTGEMIPQLTSLVDLAGKIWRNNLHILSLLTNLQKASTSIDLRHKWFQDPVRFEDALGRVIPVPSEYGWSKLEAIIRDQFSSGPGSAKVLADEYELFNTADGSLVIHESESPVLRPGLAMTMAMIIGRYEHGPLNNCPKPGCQSTNFVSKGAGGRICVMCSTWFGRSRKPIPRPWRFLSLDQLDQKESKANAAFCGGTKMDKASEHHVSTTFRKIRAERTLYKNIRFHLTDLSDAMAFVDSCAKPPRAIQQVESRGTGRFASEGPNDSNDEMIQRVLEVIAFECDIDANDFQDSTKWEDLGVDSLMSLVIDDKIRKDFGPQFDIPILVRFPTVGLLKKYLAAAAILQSNKP